MAAVTITCYRVYIILTSQLAASSKNIADNANDQSSRTTHAATAMEELNSSFVNVAQNTTEAAAAIMRLTMVKVTMYWNRRKPAKMA